MRGRDAAVFGFSNPLLPHSMYAFDPARAPETGVRSRGCQWWRIPRSGCESRASWIDATVPRPIDDRRAEHPCGGRPFLGKTERFSPSGTLTR